MYGFVCEKIKTAREGSLEAYLELIEYYQPRFLKIVEDTWGKGHEDDAIKILPNLVSNFLDSNYRTELNNYLKKYALRMYKKEIKNDKVKITNDKVINDNTDLIEEEKVKSMIENYSNRLYRSLKSNNNNILTDLELLNFSYTIMINKVSSLKQDRKNLTKRIITNNLNILTYRKIDQYKNLDNLLYDYVKLMGIKEEIVNYYEDKYKDILKDYEEKENYEVIKNDFNKIVKECLLNRFSATKSLRTIIENKIKVEYNNELSYDKINNVRNESLEIKQKVYDKYSYIKEEVFEKYKDKFDEIKLKKELEEKYNLIFDRYLYKDIKSNLGRYLRTSLEEFMGCKLRRLEKENEYFEKYKNNYMYSKEDYKDLIYYYLTKYKGYNPAEEKFKDYYDVCCKEYYKKERKSSFEEYIKRCLLEYSKKLNADYDINYLDNIINKFKDIDMISFDIKEEYFEGLKQNYIRSELYKTITFDEYLFNNVRFYDEDEYRKIKDIKNKINCKVLSR